MKVAVESWAPEYGSPVGTDAVTPTSETLVDAEVETPRASWAPIDPISAVDAERIVYFVDGVRRIDARVWLIEEDRPPRPGVCATFAAGAVRCGDRAEVIKTRVERRLIARAGAPPLDTAAGTYEPRAVVQDDLDSFFTALQTDMRSLEASIARRLDKEEGAITVFDGPLGEGRDVASSIGYIKSHRVGYLDAELVQVVGQLGPGQRTPVFVVGERVSRFTWYVRLPSRGEQPWSGIVRCECTATLPVDSAFSLADFSAHRLPAFASVEFKDPRAPQNLYPIAELERALRQRMGDLRYVERALRRAAATADLTT